MIPTASDWIVKVSVAVPEAIWLTVVTLVVGGVPGITFLTEYSTDPHPSEAVPVAYFGLY